MEQNIIWNDGKMTGLDQWISSKGIKNLLLVCDESLRFLTQLDSYLKDKSSEINIVRFSDFQPNPLYESVVSGVDVFRKNCCDGILAVGGGSAMDVAKCIKLYSNTEGDGRDGSFLKNTIVPCDIPFMAVPTTAGTGSEATRYAVVYYEGQKQSIADYSCIPDDVFMDSNVLKTLPVYQKKSTMMDAFCHAIESFWSVNSTDESREYSKQAIRLVMDNREAYLANSEEGNKNMLIAANLAGKAINITQTTAGHAMCYKITSLFGVAHGHAAILCDRVLYPWMLDNPDKCIDKRGEAHLKKILKEIADCLGCSNEREAADKIVSIFNRLELEVPTASEEQFAILKTSVNPTRLKNHPVELSVETIDELYHKILNS